MTTESATGKIFVSHAAKDQEYAKRFVDDILRHGAGLRSQDIFFTSSSDTGVDIGCNLMGELQSNVLNSGLVIALITPAFQESLTCVAESGAAWARDVFFPLRSSGLGAEALKGIFPSVLCGQVDDRGNLFRLMSKLNGMGFSIDVSTFSDGVERWMKALAGGLKPSPSPSDSAAERVQKLAEENGRLKADLVEMRKQIESGKVEIAGLRSKLGDEKGGLKGGRRNDVAARAEVSEDASSRAAALDAGGEVCLSGGEVEGEIACFEKLCNKMRSALKGCGSPVVGEALWQHFVRRPMWIPDQLDEPRLYKEIDKEINRGTLKWDEERGVLPNLDVSTVWNAYEAVCELGGYMESADRSEEFENWFEGTFDTGADFSIKDCWEALLSA